MAVHKVENLSKVDPTRYFEGDLFISKQGAALLLNGKLETIMKRTDIRKMIRDEIRKERK